MFWIILCFLTVVSLHMMPLRAISQAVRVKPHCSNSLFNIKKHRKWKRMLKQVSQFKHKTQYYLNLFKCFWHFCVFWMVFCCIWCRCVQSHRKYDFNQIIQIIYLNTKKHRKWKRMLKQAFEFKHKTILPRFVQMFLTFFVFFQCCSVAYDAVACNLTVCTSSTTLFKYFISYKKAQKMKTHAKTRFSI